MIRDSGRWWGKHWGRIVWTFAFVAAPASSGYAQLSPEKEIWSRVDGPSFGISEPIGSPSAGCLRGGIELERRGSGFHLVTPERGHHFGSVELVHFIRGWAKDRLDAGELSSIPISDLSLPRGGPSLVAHASHQTGLDVDVWYRSETDASGKPLKIVLYPQREVIPDRFTKREFNLLKSAALRSEVDRIFVNYAVKKAVCASAEKGEWVRKIRPWYGHDSHFHVRLKCPPGSRSCKRQPELPRGDGCGKELAGWWSGKVRKEEALAEAWERLGKHPDWRMPNLPSSCDRILAEGKTYDEQESVEQPGESFAHSGRFPIKPSISSSSE